MVHFSLIDRLQFEIQIQAITRRVAEDFERRMAWYDPEGWRLAVGLLMFAVALPVFTIAVFREVLLAWSDLDPWERARAVLISIYLLIFAGLWSWGVASIFAWGAS